ncbi:hypothetical protein ACFXI8_31790 [Streptomyces niveus]|uniref:hypothetical protein n=1 Tax=Streptomyces niveus TaxID=193462 RepID=UPI0036B23FE4
MRPERNDNTIDSQQCVFTARINANEQGILTFRTAWYSGTSGGWSSDGLVAHDVGKTTGRPETIAERDQLRR